MISTTLNIHNKILSNINHGSVKLGKSRREIIVLLLMRMMKDHRLYTRSFSTVKYQQDDDSGNWHCFHIRLREDENEFFVDLRKVCKCSVSCLLAMAVERYLDKVINDADKNPIDNYRDFKNYFLYQDVVDGIFSWHLYWGIPIKQLKNLRL